MKSMEKPQVISVQVFSAPCWLCLAGNVRELRNVLERAWVLAGERSYEDFNDLRMWLDVPQTDDRRSSVDLSLPFKDAKKSIGGAFERRYLAALLF
ncbi:MAG: hypothetical protein R3C68_01765 [Myxococcota bacterium]